MKKKYQIKNRYINKIIVEMEAENFKEVVTKNKANLQGADLQGVNLRRASLWGANLWRAKIKITQKEDLIKCLGVTIEA
jgi:uncharacterized protein YjbI with pentapeptide repeats